MSGQIPTTTARISIRPQTIREAYEPPANVLEVDVINPQTHGLAGKRFTDYEVRLKVKNFTLLKKKFNFFIDFSLKTNLPVFKIKESSVRRRFSDFEWLRNELERGSKVSKVLLLF